MDPQPAGDDRDEDDAHDDREERERAQPPARDRMRKGPDRNRRTR